MTGKKPRQEVGASAYMLKDCPLHPQGQDADVERGWRPTCSDVCGALVLQTTLQHKLHEAVAVAALQGPQICSLCKQKTAETPPEPVPAPARFCKWLFPVSVLMPGKVPSGRRVMREHSMAGAA